MLIPVYHVFFCLWDLLYSSRALGFQARLEILHVCGIPKDTFFAVRRWRVGEGVLWHNWNVIFLRCTVFSFTGLLSTWKKKMRISRKALAWRRVPLSTVCEFLLAEQFPRRILWLTWRHASRCLVIYSKRMLSFQLQRTIEFIFQVWWCVRLWIECGSLSACDLGEGCRWYIEVDLSLVVFYSFANVSGSIHERFSELIQL
jgi:hypothetical protein